MRRNAAGRLAKLEAAWYQEQCRRMDAMTDEELAGQIGSGAGEVMDGLSPDELAWLFRCAISLRFHAGFRSIPHEIV